MQAAGLIELAPAWCPLGRIEGLWWQTRDPHGHAPEAEFALEFGKLVDDGDGEHGQGRGVEHDDIGLRSLVDGSDDLAVGRADVRRV